MDIKGGKEGGMSWEIGIDVSALWMLYTQWVTSENLLESTGGSPWYPVMTYWGGMWGGGREVQEGGIYAYIQLLHFVVQQKLI